MTRKLSDAELQKIHEDEVEQNMLEATRDAVHAARKRHTWGGAIQPGEHTIWDGKLLPTPIGLDDVRGEV